MKFQRSKRYDKIKNFKDCQERIEELHVATDNMLEDYTERITSIWIVTVFLYFILFTMIMINTFG